jgi:SAM-dependent methyltransferase
MKRLIKAVLPRAVCEWIARKRFPTCRPPVGWVRFGSFRRSMPISAEWGIDRGHPIDRYYIESFLSDHGADIRGRVLEVADNQYTRQFGGDRVTKSEILHATPDNPDATYVSDLAKADNIPSDAFDCIILTQVMQYIYDLRAATRHLHRILKPGGVVLVTVPGCEKINLAEGAKWSDYWRFSVKSAETLFAEEFGSENVRARSYGNVFVAVASLMGLSQEDIKRSELEVQDERYPLIIAVRAVKTAK